MSKVLLDAPLDISVQKYKAEQAEAQRVGADIGTYPQWRASKVKQDKFRQGLVKAKEAEKNVDSTSDNSGDVLVSGDSGKDTKQQVKPKRKRRTRAEIEADKNK